MACIYTLLYSLFCHHLARDIRVDHFSRNETGLYRVPASLWLTRCLCMWPLSTHSACCVASILGPASLVLSNQQLSDSIRPRDRPWTDMRSMEPMTIRPNAQNTVSVGDVIVRRFEKLRSSPIVRPTQASFYPLGVLRCFNTRPSKSGPVLRSMEPMTIRPNAQNTVSVGDVIVRRFENYQW
jgi:hypothetical protein